MRQRVQHPFQQPSKTNLYRSSPDLQGLEQLTHVDPERRTFLRCPIERVDDMVIHGVEGQIYGRNISIMVFLYLLWDFNLFNHAWDGFDDCMIMFGWVKTTIHHHPVLNYHELPTSTQGIAAGSLGHRSLDFWTVSSGPTDLEVVLKYVQIWRFPQRWLPQQLDGLMEHPSYKMDDDWGYPHDFGNFHMFIVR